MGRANAGDILRRDLGLDVGVVLFDRELPHFLGELAGQRRPRRHLEARKHRKRQVERAFAVALAAFVPFAEEIPLDELVVLLGVLEFLLRLLPEHLRLQIHHFRQRRDLHESKPSFRIGLADLVVDALQILLELLDDEIGLLDIAPELLQMRLHADRAAEQHGVLVGETFGDEFVHDVAHRLKRGIALLLLLVGAGFGHAHLQIAILGGQRKPVLAVEVGQQFAVHCGGLVVVLGLGQNLSVGIARIHIKFFQPLGRFGELGEEIVVDFHALVLLVAAEIIVGHFQTRRPILGALAVGQRSDQLFRLLELVEREHSAHFDGEESGLRLRPALLGGGDDRFGDIRIAVGNERLDKGYLAFHGFAIGLLLGRLLRSLLFRLLRPHRRACCHRHQGEDEVFIAHGAYIILYFTLLLQVKFSTFFIPTRSWRAVSS